MNLDKLTSLFWKNAPTLLKANECWLWWKSLKASGYGNCWDGYKNQSSHRVSFLIHKGFIPDKADIMHRCDNRNCVNPNHLSIGSRLDNMRDASTKGRLKHTPKQFCKHGHEFSVANTAFYDKKRPSKRSCKECHRIKEQIRRNKYV